MSAKLLQLQEHRSLMKVGAHRLADPPIRSHEPPSALAALQLIPSH